ncbi:MAG: hypothetical protein DMF98_28635 [Acidobacteria bacterium]|nr:MAG: hypothetical protein DMF98_28635 [Acidobacteriota bacterium]
MPLLTRMRSWWRSVLHRSEMERSMSEELQFHLACRARDRVSGAALAGAISEMTVRFGEGGLKAGTLNYEGARKRAAATHTEQEGQSQQPAA